MSLPINASARWALLCLLAGQTVLAADEPAGWLGAGPTRTPYYAQESGRPGPKVLIVAGIHGDEPAGPAAAEQIRHWPIQKGSLLVVPRASVAALAAKTRLSPDGGTNRVNLNRVFPPRESPGGPAQELAAELWSLVKTQRPDWLLDLHEGGDFRGQTTNSVGSSVIAADMPEAVAAARKILDAVNATVTESNRAFVFLSRPVKGSLARAAADELGARALILETTIKSQALALRTRQHRLAVHCLLSDLGMIPDEVTPNRLLAGAQTEGRIAVAVYDGPGNGGAGVPKVLEEIGRQPDMLAVRVSADDLRGGALEGFQAVMFTGGSGSGQAKALGLEGRQRIREFVDRGGCYIGICAGSYLACSGFSWGLGLIDARTLSPLWQRGKATVKVELTPAGRRALGMGEGWFDCLYAQGPIVGPAEDENLPDYEVLAWFRTEVAANNTPKGIMLNSPAVFAGHFGRGRVICFSPHPEQTKGLESWISGAVAWGTQRTPESLPTQ